MLVQNRTSSGEGAVGPEETVPQVGWKMSVSPALLSTHQLCPLP